MKRIGKKSFFKCDSLEKIIFSNPCGWKKVGGGLFSNIPEDILSNPSSAAEALKNKYVEVAIERG